MNGTDSSIVSHSYDDVFLNRNDFTIKSQMDDMDVVLEPIVSQIFLETPAARGTAGVFALSAILITCFQVFFLIWFPLQELFCIYN